MCILSYSFPQISKRSIILKRKKLFSQAEENLFRSCQSCRDSIRCYEQNTQGEGELSLGPEKSNIKTAERQCSGFMRMYFAFRQHKPILLLTMCFWPFRKSNFCSPRKSGSFAVGNQTVARDYDLFGFLFFDVALGVVKIS